MHPQWGRMPQSCRVTSMLWQFCPCSICSLYLIYPRCYVCGVGSNRCVTCGVAGGVTGGVASGHKIKSGIKSGIVGDDVVSKTCGSGCGDTSGLRIFGCVTGGIACGITGCVKSGVSGG